MVARGFLLVPRCSIQSIDLQLLVLGTLNKFSVCSLYKYSSVTMPKKRSLSNEKDEQVSKKVKADASPTDKSSSEGSTSGGKKFSLKIISWNVNGIRAWAKKDGLSILEKEDPDIFCIQETKCAKGKIPPELKPKGYKSYFFSAEKEGYAGVGLYSKAEPISVVDGLDDDVHDKEGRVITAEYEDFYLVTTYVPNAGRGLVTLDKRMDWDPKFLKHLKELDSKKPVIMCGDLNVAHNEIDLSNPKSNKKNAGFTQEERDGFSTLLEGGFVDSYRELYPDKTGAYTFWTYLGNARAKNVGWRLDYFVLSSRLKDRMCDSLIHSSVMGSDHCPISLLMDLSKKGKE